MFAKPHRFSFKKGVPKNTFSTSFFFFFYDRNSEAGLRCGVVVGKKVDKRAVVRNRFKRQLVAFVKELLGQDKKYNLVIIAKKQIKDVEHDQVKEELKKAFLTIHIL